MMFSDSALVVVYDWLSGDRLVSTFLVTNEDTIFNLSNSQQIIASIPVGTQPVRYT